MHYDLSIGPWASNWETKPFSTSCTSKRNETCFIAFWIGRNQAFVGEFRLPRGSSSASEKSVSGYTYRYDKITTTQLECQPLQHAHFFDLWLLKGICCNVAQRGLQNKMNGEDRSVCASIALRWLFGGKLGILVEEAKMRAVC